MILFILFITFFKIGAVTFGGGYAMLPLIQQDVLKHEWLSLEDLVDFIAISESTPGPFAVNVSTYIGYESGGFLGALLATLGVILPSFVIILIVAKMYDRFQNSNLVKGAMFGLKPTVVGLIGATVFSTCVTIFSPLVQSSVYKTVSQYEFIAGACILITMAFALYKKVHPLLIIVASGVLGILVNM